MSCTENKYLCSIYEKNVIKLSQYLKHVTTFADFDNITFTYELNTSLIAGANKFGISFSVPTSISDLYSGKVGALTEDNIRAYYTNFYGSTLSTTLSYVEFRDDCTGILLTYDDPLPDLNDDILPQTVNTDSLIFIKNVVKKYRDFYAYLYKKACCKDEELEELLSCCKKEKKTCCDNCKYNSGPCCGTTTATSCSSSASCASSVSSHRYHSHCNCHCK